MKITQLGMNILVLLLFVTPAYALDVYPPDGTTVIEFRDADPFGGPIGNRQGTVTVEDSDGERRSYDVYTPETYEGKTRIELRPSVYKD